LTLLVDNVFKQQRQSNINYILGGFENSLVNNDVFLGKHKQQQKAKQFFKTKNPHYNDK